MDDLRVLVYGELDAGVSDLYRFGQFRVALAGHGVILRPWSELGDFTVGIPAIPGLEPDAAIALGLGSINLGPLDWADVIVFRRWYSLGFCCAECDTVAPDEPILADHARLTGHAVSTPERHLPVLWRELMERARVGRGPAIVYDTDDDLFGVPEWTGLRARVSADLELLGSIIREADLVTTTTPVLADRLAARASGPVRVVRNALDPGWYATPGRAPGDVPTVAGVAQPADGGGPRIVYHGVARRLRDYEVARAAIDEVVHHVPGARRVWVGAAGDPAVDAAVDESHPFVPDPVGFAAALVAPRPDIGLAPVVDEPYNRARSELHWLEYSLAGAATIATRTAGPGPYDVIRDGQDGLLARTPEEWRRCLRRLAGSADLREELAGRAGERVLAEWTVAVRAIEWADAYRAAAGIPPRLGVNHSRHFDRPAARTRRRAAQARACRLRYQRGRAQVPPAAGTPPSRS